MSRKQQSLSLETKQKILNEVCDGILKKTEIATKYGIPNSTLSTIIKNREKIEVAYAINQFEPARKRMRTGGNEEIEVALLRWVREARSQNLPLTGHVLQEKAKVFADALGVTNFASSNGWLTRFKKRHGIVCHKICGEEATVDKETVESFLSEKWPALRKNYAPRDIFNADETGLFFKALPSRTLSIKGEKCSGGKCSKERITVLVACNMDGTEKLPLFVVGKSANPRCFKNLKTLPVVYASNKKAWMNKMLFKKWLTDLDRKLFREKRNICLMLDNCSAHNDIHGLKAIKCVFLPPNTTFIRATTAAALQVYSGKAPELKESSGCVNFVRRINTIVDAMNSGTHLTALKLNSLPYKLLLFRDMQDPKLELMRLANFPGVIGATHVDILAPPKKDTQFVIKALGVLFPVKDNLTVVELKENVCNCYTVATTSTFICPHQTRPVNTENVVGMHTVPIRFRNVDNDMDQNPIPPILKSKQHEFAGDLSKLLPIKVAKHSLGKMFSKCSYCGALRFASAKGRSVNSCCHNDNIHIPPLHEYPLFLKNLLLSDEQEAKLFRQNIRVYNSSFAFATFSAKFLQDESRGPPLIKIQGQVYHHATTSLNSATNAPRNGQIYIYDSVEEAIKLRMNLDNLQLTRHIEKLLREVNPYAQKYRMLRDLTIHDSEFVLQFQRFIFDDKRRYNKPTSSELAAIIVSKDGVVPVCDLTVYPKQEIRETSIINQRSQHADPMVFPLLFPKGDLGWTYQMPSQKGKQISPIQYYGHRLALRPNGPFNPLLHAGKLSQQYVINCYLLVETLKCNSPFQKRLTTAEMAAAGTEVSPLGGKLFTQPDIISLRIIIDHVRYRFLKPTIEELISKIGSQLESDTDWNNALTPTEKVLAAVRFYAFGNQHINLGDTQKMNQPSVSRIISKVSQCLAELRPQYIYLPQSEAERMEDYKYAAAKENFLLLLDCSTSVSDTCTSDVMRCSTSSEASYIVAGKDMWTELLAQVPSAVVRDSNVQNRAIKDESTLTWDSLTILREHYSI
nr:uncharacterized protein LOC122272279 [Parasteatoda tepidariorum]